MENQTHTSVITEEAQIQKLLQEFETNLKNHKNKRYPSKGLKISQGLAQIEDLYKPTKKMNNPELLAPDSTLLFIDSSQSFEHTINPNEQFHLEILNKKENILFIKMVLKFFSIPRRVIRALIKYQKKYKISLGWILKACLVCLSCYLIMTVVSPIINPLLNRAFLALKNQLSLPITKLKKQVNRNQKKESKEFWDNQLGALSQVIKISRGGKLVPIREANIYDFSALDQEQALLFASPIPAYIKFEKAKSKLEKLIVELEETQTQRKPISQTITKGYLKVKEFTSKLTNSLTSKTNIKKLILILSIIGTINVLMAGNRENMRLAQPQQLHNYERLVPPHPSVPSILPRVELSIKEETRNIDSIRMEMKDSLNTPSRLKSGDRVRKKAKLVRLSDLPPLRDQDFDLDIDSTAIARPTSMKIRLD